MQLLFAPFRAYLLHPTALELCIIPLDTRPARAYTGAMHYPINERKDTMYILVTTTGEGTQANPYTRCVWTGARWSSLSDAPARGYASYANARRALSRLINDGRVFGIATIETHG